MSYAKHLLLYLLLIFAFVYCNKHTTDSALSTSVVPNTPEKLYCDALVRGWDSMKVITYAKYTYFGAYKTEPEKYEDVYLRKHDYEFRKDSTYVLSFTDMGEKHIGRWNFGSDTSNYKYIMLDKNTPKEKIIYFYPYKGSFDGCQMEVYLQPDSLFGNKYALEVMYYRETNSNTRQAKWAWF